MAAQYPAKKADMYYNQLEKLTYEFNTFVSSHKYQNRLAQAQVHTQQIRTDLEKQFGHYNCVRRLAVGILQANDIGIISKSSVQASSDEAFLSAPDYWLTPCVCALAAWMNDNSDMAETAVKEAVRRDSDKSSLFFMLACRRMGRNQASLKWAQKYLEGKNEEELPNNFIVLLNAYAGGLLDEETDKLIAEQIGEWFRKLTENPDSVSEQWVNSLKAKTGTDSDDKYTYLSKYSKTWPQVKAAADGADLLAYIADYLQKVIEQSVSSGSLEEQIDKLLTSLVTDFDNEELPLRRKARFEQLVINFNGNEDIAKQHMSKHESAFKTEMSFTDILIDSALKTNSSKASAAAQKLAVKLSEAWIAFACEKVMKQIIKENPNFIEIDLGSFSDITSNGDNGDAIVERFNSYLSREPKTDKTSSQKSNGEQIIYLMMSEAADFRSKIERNSNQNKKIINLLKQNNPNQYSKMVMDYVRKTS